MTSGSPFCSDHHSCCEVPSAGLIALTAVGLLTLYSATMTLLSSGLGLAVELGVACFYFLLALIALSPLQPPGSESRSTLFRLTYLVSPHNRHITFIDPTNPTGLLPQRLCLLCRGTLGRRSHLNVQGIYSYSNAHVIVPHRITSHHVHFLSLLLFLLLH